MKAVKNNYNISIINDNFKKKFTNSILLIPIFQKIINSLFVSYFEIIYEILKNITNGINLVNIFGKLSKV